MAIISKESWAKFTQEERDEVRKLYSGVIEGLADSEIGERQHIYLSALQDRYISLFGKENLQTQPLTYEDVEKELIKKTPSYNIGYMLSFGESPYKGLTAPYFFSAKQAEKVLAINKMLNVAAYLNQSWKPDWFGIEQEQKWVIKINRDNEIQFQPYSRENVAIVYFRTEEMARQAIEILGEDVIRAALSTDY